MEDPTRDLTDHVAGDSCKTDRLMRLIYDKLRERTKARRELCPRDGREDREYTLTANTFHATRQRNQVQRLSDMKRLENLEDEARSL